MNCFLHVFRLAALSALALSACTSADNPPNPLVRAVVPAQGRLGTPVRLVGTGFGTDAGRVAVSFNGVSAVVTAARDSVLLTTVPPGAGTGPIRVRVGEVETTAPSAFEYLFTARTSTLAGGGEGYADGRGADARFVHPYHISVDAQGTFYVADQINSLVRKITPDGTVSTLAGGTQGFRDGKGPQARLKFPIGVFAAPDGSVYVADSFNSSIRKIAPDGTLTTVVGSPDRVGFTDGPVAEAQLRVPYAVWVSRENVLWICDTENHRLRRLGTDGRLTTWAGSTEGHADGPLANARFRWPVHLTFDATGNAYVADKHNHCIRKISPDGTVSTLAGQPGQSGFADGRGGEARFYQPSSVALDPAGHLYVTDLYNHRVRCISPTGYVSTLVGDGTPGFAEGTGEAARLHYPQGCVWQSGNRLVVTDSYNNRIRVLGLE